MLIKVEIIKTHKMVFLMDQQMTNLPEEKSSEPIDN